MERTDNLLRLVKSLDERERRMVIGHFTGRSEKKDRLYLELFRALEKMEIDAYNPQAVQQTVGISGRKLATTRYYLQQAILSALRHNYDSSNIESRLWNTIAEAEILASKGLSVMALKKLNTAQKLCSEYPHPYFIVRVQRLRAALEQSIETDRHDYISELEAFSTTISQSALRLGEHEFCIQVIQHAGKCLRHGQAPDPKMLDQAAQLIESSNTDADPVVQLLASMLALMKATNIDVRNTEVTRLCELLKHSMPNTLSDSDHTAIAEGLYWIGDLLIRDSQPQALHEMIGVLRARITGSTKNNILKIVYHTLTLRLADAYHIAGDSDTQHDSSTAISVMLSNSRTARNVSPAMSLEALCWTASFYVSRGEYEQASHRLTLLFQHPWFTKASEDLKVACKLLYLVCIFELGRFKELGSASRDLVLLIHTCKGLFGYELNFINNMRRVKVFDSMRAETQFYQEVLERVESTRCENLYLILSDSVITTRWLTTRFPHYQK